MGVFAFDELHNSHTAGTIHDELVPWNEFDQEAGWPLIALCRAIAAPLNPIVDLTRDDPDNNHPGWGQALMPTIAPEWMLDWLGQLVGLRFPPDATVAEKRAGMDRRHLLRGTPAATVAAAQATLTGTRTVHMVERVGGDAAHYSVTTIASETPDPAATEAAVRATKHWGLRLTYSTVPGGDWDTLIGAHADWDSVVSTFTDWADVIADPSQT